MKIRDESLARLRSNPAFDVLILGGGVNGVAVLRELALNGISALLVDRSDFCRGASGASSRMAHGGLRYLENREFALVAESTRERNRLLRLAPHYVRPLEVVVPLTSHIRGLWASILRFLGLSARQGTLSAAALTGALRLYEFLGRVGNTLPRHKTQMSRARFPAHLAARYKAVITYFDARITNPESLVMEMIEDALAAHPRAACLNYIQWAAGSDGAFHIEDPISGFFTTIHPKLVVNAAGAWVDTVNATMGLVTRYVRLVKGAHLLLRNEALRRRMDGKAYYFDDGNGRMVICYPLDHTILLGTTEIQVADADDDGIAPEEVSYLLSALNTLFDDIRVQPSDIVSMTTGIRPLQMGNPAVSANRANRDHLIAEDQLSNGGTPVLSLVGGKWTTFRSFGEQAADRILAHLGGSRSASTSERPYPGSIGFAPASAGQDATINRIVSKTFLPRERVAILVTRYGAIAAEVAAVCAEPGDQPLASLPDYSTGELIWLITRRAPIRLDDLLLRRTQIVLDGRCTENVLREVGQLLGRVRGQSAAWVEAEIQRCRAMPVLCLRQTATREAEVQHG